MLFRKGKKIVIAGSSQWGARLAGQLSGKGYDVVVVDSRRDAFRKLPEDFNGNQVEGDVTDPKVLERCGAGKAVAFIAATQNDNVNLMVGQIARCLMEVEHVYVMLEDQQRQKIIGCSGIKTICPLEASAEECARLVGEACRKEAV